MHGFARSVPYLTMLALAVIACGEADPETGTTDAETMALEAPPMAVTLDVRIDGYEHDLVPINWLGVSPAGEVALLQWQDHQVRFFDATGAATGSFGADGEGPGEFRRLVRAGWVGDTLWVSDTQLGRVTLIGPDHTLVRTVRPPDVVEPPPDAAGDARSYSMVFPYAMYPRDAMLLSSLQVASGPPLEDGKVGTLIRASGDGTLLSEVAWLTLSSGVARVEVGRGVLEWPAPFAATREWVSAADGSRVAFVDTDLSEEPGRLNVEVRDAAGQPIFRRTFEFERVPIPAEHMDSAIIATAAGRPANVQRLLERALRDVAPEFYPGADEIRLGADHRVWIGLYTTGDERDWVVLDPHGEPEARITLPANVELWAADASHVWGVERDELDVQSVVRYRLGKEPEHGTAG